MACCHVVKEVAVTFGLLLLGNKGVMGMCCCVHAVAVYLLCAAASLVTAGAAGRSAHAVQLQGRFSIV